MPESFEIVAGTYEQFLLGYKVEYTDNECRMDKSFAMHSHLASIRSVSSSKHYLASGGADDSVYLYDMLRRTESGKLIHHNDTVNCLEFTPDASHLLTCSSDGTIAAVRCGNWQLEKHWQKPHKGLAVNTLAIHPSGRMALSAGADGVLRTWNLVKGRQAYATNLVTRLKRDAKNVNIVKWSPNGERYLLAANCRIDLYSTQTAGIVDGVTLNSKVICMEFLDDALIAIGTDSGCILFYDLTKLVETLSEMAHSNRIKGIAHRRDLLVTASSLGEIKLWKYTKSTLINLKTVSSGARITCLSITAWNNNTLGKNVDTASEVEEHTKNEPTSSLKLKQQVTIEYDDKSDKVDASVVNGKPKHKSRGKDACQENGNLLKNKKKRKKRKSVKICDTDDRPSVEKRKKKEGNGEYSGNCGHPGKRVTVIAADDNNFSSLNATEHEISGNDGKYREIGGCGRSAWIASENDASVPLSFTVDKDNDCFIRKSKKAVSGEKRSRASKGGRKSIENTSPRGGPLTTIR